MALPAAISISKILLFVASIFKRLQENVFVISENLLKALGCKVVMKHVSITRYFV